MDVIYTDLSKVFDVVNHEILIAKLPGFGLLGLFKLLLFGKTHYVEYGGHKSRLFIKNSGVTQSSNPGPV